MAYIFNVAKKLDMEGLKLVLECNQFPQENGANDWQLLASWKFHYCGYNVHLPEEHGMLLLSRVSTDYFHSAFISISIWR